MHTISVIRYRWFHNAWTTEAKRYLLRRGNAWEESMHQSEYMRAIFNLRASLKLGKTKRYSNLEAIGYLVLRQAYRYMYFKDGISIPFGIQTHQ